MVCVLCEDFLLFFLMMGHPRRSTLFPYTTLFRSAYQHLPGASETEGCDGGEQRHQQGRQRAGDLADAVARRHRSEEHTSELQSHVNLVCRLLLEKKKQIMISCHLIDQHLPRLQLP